jgi:hypothetical protein
LRSDVADVADSAASKAAKSRQGHLALHQLPGRLRLCRPRHLRHDAVRQACDRDDLGRDRDVARRAPACRRSEGQTDGTPEREDPHPPALGGFEGQASDIEIQAREAIALKRRIEEIVARHSGQPLEKVAKDMERDYFMTAGEAVEYGLIDNVLARRFKSDARPAV